jgi:membrane protein DedA with SNARE-associated domain
MDNKKGINFMWLIIAFILGTTLFKHFNFQTLRFKMPALDIIFLITFIATIYILIKDYKKRRKE